jgi:hypothetical protein
MEQKDAMNCRQVPCLRANCSWEDHRLQIQVITTVRAQIHLAEANSPFARNSQAQCQPVSSTGRTLTP